MRLWKTQQTERPSVPQTLPEEDAPQEVASGLGLSGTLVIGVVLMLLVTVLAVQNTDSTRLEFLTWETSLPLVGLLLAAVLVGVVFDEVAGWLWRHRRRRQLAVERELVARRRSSTEAVVSEATDSSDAAAPIDQDHDPEMLS